MKKAIPFEFVLEELAKLKPTTRPMFGCTAVYVGEKIVFVLREKSAKDKDGGVWIATEQAHHASLKEELPSLRPISIFGAKGNWRMLPMLATSFETDVLRACELVHEGDERIGRIPGAKAKKKAKKKVATKKTVAKRAR